ncbi:glycerate kinase [Amycolatopsis acidiphila]|uniref:Glycerate kinase n=1 Tax=Amycolatopsis acidiphila TaxID=715473 RepID=A0A558A7H7_9PSEU|nr:glycerate kinase [Amycolatopsis acidiphila]TVT20217.1 glycerate kinase [Amycolatopsis acidiphila]UIJ58234.1 glycerate kinase [Amycolatopsis acidiphila]GHG69261.1 glycerate kinase [Amycolatopsis acidiphila]
MPKVVIAPDKFKGTLPAKEVADAIAAGLRRAVPDVETLECPIADGGDGTVAAAVAAGFEYVPAEATGPTGERVRTGYARRDGTAVVELAAVSGLTMMPELAPLTSNTLGVGELIAHALDGGCTKIVLGLGGSASTDGGAGLVRGLGARLLDAEGNEIPLGGRALLDLASIDLTGLRRAEIVVASDVDNPLLGEYGAAAVYGPQKGATPADVALLDSALKHFADIVGTELVDAPGAGAAGGTGFAALAVLGATFRPGIDVILEMTGFADKLPGADLVITGEGSFDEQTLHGKGPAGIAQQARGIPVVAMAGRIALSRETLVENGFSAGYGLTDIESDVERCMTDTAVLLEQLAAKVAADWL